MNKAILIAGGSTIIFLTAFSVSERIRFNKLMHAFINLNRLDDFKTRMIDELFEEAPPGYDFSDKLKNDIMAWALLYQDDII